jgi:hypothetical protein
MKAGRGVKRIRNEVPFEPLRCMIDHGLQCPGLGKEMTRGWDDFQFLGAVQTSQGVLVQLDYTEIVTPND